jgi:hypothetical protein
MQNLGKSRKVARKYITEDRPPAHRALLYALTRVFFFPSRRPVSVELELLSTMDSESN